MFKGHPRGLSVLFFTEMWERFSYYGGRALLILYMTDQVVNGGLGFGVVEAGALYGLYTASVYMTNLPGGWIADKFIGAKNAVLYGGAIIALGNFFLTFTDINFFYIGLACIAIGTGLLKPNVSTLVGSLYPKGDNRRDAGFSLFYMGINLGAFLAPLICGYLGQRVDWRLGFGAVAIGMVLGLIQFRMGWKYLGEAGDVPKKTGGIEDEKRRKSLIYGAATLVLLILIPAVIHITGIQQVNIEWFRNAVGVLLVIIPLLYFGSLFIYGKWTTQERNRIFVIILFYLAAAVFWSAFEQAGSTLNLFADRLTNNVIFGFEFPSTWWQSVNSIFIILLAPAFATLWVKLSQIGKEPSTPMKFAYGLLFLGLSFLVMMLPAQQILNGPEGMRVGAQWLLLFYFLSTVGELCLSPVGLSAMTRLAPEKIVGQMMGIWFLGAATGNFFAGIVGGQFESMPLPDLFFNVAMTVLVTGVLFVIFSRPIQRLIGSDQ
jgi:POT family proton-dependent oligopeptide transporter